MSKIRIGNKVTVKENGKIGTVVGREEKKLEGKKIEVRYVVKTEDGFENYKAFSRKEITKVPSVVSETNPNNNKVYPKIYNLEYPCSDGRTLVLTGVVDNYYDNVSEFEEYRTSKVMEIMKVKRKMLIVGYAICHPDDKNDKDLGAEIALRRAYKKPISILYSPFSGEFRDDLVIAILQTKAAFIEENIDRFIERDNNL